ncbi:arginase family protein [Dactylosporangium sp. NPDC005555]|uniref:arginase family protein n=1 Tax=Dactylosporangium sp. NPDC005555 TaxID=3154889 RepID=UPI0033A9AC6A
MLNLVRRLCAAPGAGWASSSGGHAPLAVPLHERRYGTSQPAAVRFAWLDELSGAGPAVCLLGVPYAGGSYGISCSDSGPLGIRLAMEHRGIGRHTLRDLGDVRYLPGPPTDDMLAPQWLERIRAERHGDAAAQLPVSMLSAAAAIAGSCAAGGVPLITLGGDHSVSAATIRGLGAAGVGLLHIDAHGDLSTGRDGLQLLHSSWIHAADATVGLAAVVQVGVVDGSVLPQWLDGRVLRLDTTDVDGAAAAAAAAVAFLAARGCDQVYLSIDIDALTSHDAPATGLPGGDLRLGSLLTFLDALGHSSAAIRWVGADVTEVAPTLSGLSGWAEEPTCGSAALLVERLAELLSPR